MSIRNNIKRIRELRGWSQEQLGTKLGKTHGAVSKDESGLRQLTIHKLEIYARALDCSIVDLISDGDKSANKDLNVTEMQHIIEICSDVIFHEFKADIDPKIFAEIIIDVYKWAKEENANDNDLSVFLKGMLRHEKRIANKGAG